MRDVTTIDHETAFVGVLWNQATQTGNYDNWGRLPIDTIVCHSMDGTLDGSTAWFRRQGGKNSAHYGVAWNGRVVNWIPENCVAYHAGRYPVNQRSISIEGEDFGNNQAVRPDTFYEKYALLVADIAAFYSIPLDRDHVKKHNEFVNTGCPGTLDIDRIINRAKEILALVSGEEKEVSHMMKPSVFGGMVTKSTEYDKTWAALGLDPSMKTRPESHTIILDYLNAKISEARNMQAPVNPVNVPSEVPQADSTPISPSEQDISIWEKDVFSAIGNFFKAFRRQKTT